MLLTLAALTVAAGQSLPKPPEPRQEASRLGGKSPWHCLRRLGEMEVNLVIRFSSLGIRSSNPDGKGKAPRVAKVAHRRHPEQAALEPAGSR